MIFVRRFMRIVSLPVVGVLCALVASVAAMPDSAASAGAIVLTADAGANRPGVAVDSSGTGHFAWAENVTSGPDRIVYCRLPRGKSACEGVQAFVPDGLESFGGVRVLLPAPGSVILVANRCCNDATYAYSSSDSGQTFSGPVAIGTVEPFDAVAGPGPFTVSMIDHSKTNGIEFQAAPSAGPQVTDTARLGKGLGEVGINDMQAYYGSIAFVDPSTPIAGFSDGDTVFYRIFNPGAGPDYNNVANWRATETVGPGDEPKVAGGPSGVYIAHNVNIPGQDRYVVRKLNATTLTFGAPTTVSETGDPIFRDFAEDGSGRLHAVWIANGMRGDPLRYRWSSDGAKWRPIQTLQARTDDEAFNLRLGLAPDGGGFVVYDANGGGPIVAVPIAPKGSGAGGGDDGAACPISVQLTQKVEARARGGCLQKTGAGRYESTGEVRVNGIDFQPGTSAGSAANAAGAGKIRIDTTKNTVHATGDVTVGVGPVTLHKGSLLWDVDKEVKFTKLDAFGGTVLAFAATGEADVSFQPGGARIDVRLKLPAFFEGVTGQTKLKTSQADGLSLDGIAIDVPTANVGALVIRNLHVAFTGGFNTFEGGADLVFPPQSEKGIGVSFGFKDGKFAHAEAEVGPPVPPFPLSLSVPPGLLFMQRIKLGVSTETGFTVSGGTVLTGGPEIAGTSAITIDALSPPNGFIFDFPADKDYAELSVGGELKVVNLALAAGKVAFRTDGLLTFEGNASVDFPSSSVGIVGARGAVDGFVNVTNGAFSAEGEVKVCAPASCMIKVLGIDTATPVQGTGKVLVSSKAVAACAKIAGAGIGGAIKWSGGVDVFASGGCDLGAYKVASGARAAEGPGTFRLPKGLPEAGVQVTGEGGVPSVTLAGPGGVSIAGDIADPAQPLVRPPFVLYTDASTNRVFIHIVEPAAGDWNVTANPGSVPIAGIKTAEGLPDVSVKARVHGTARGRTLDYSLRSIPGQRVTFFERADQVARKIGTAQGSRGKLRFSPAEGPSGRREIVAMVEQDGVPRSQDPVAAYSAPPAERPARPRALRVRRKGGGLGITWSGAGGAARYRIEVELHDGRRLLYLPRAGARRRVVVPDVQPGDSGLVTVAALTELGRAGPAARARIKRS